MGKSLQPRHRHSSAASRLASPSWRRWVAVFALLAFALQTQITQTHVHFASSQAFGLSSGDEATASAKIANKAAPQKSAPANDDPAKCPICQAVMHAGQFISPSTISFALPSEAIAIIPLSLVIAIARERASHNWQGRAPPRH
jgi:hypothetical protein